MNMCRKATERDNAMKRFMEQIVGNDRIKNRLCSDVLSGRFSHAYIIEGIKGSGKHTLARLTAAALACENKNDPSAPLPCGVCENCRKIGEFLRPEVIKVGTAGQATLGVDSVRHIREDVFTVPNDLDNKLYIIEDADKMTVQAQNAFLLTLEEPPAYVGFILLCENSDALLETIRSRAPILRTESVSKEDIDEYICSKDRRAKEMKLSAPDDYAELLMAAENGIGKALALLDPKELAPILERRRLAKDFLASSLGNGSHKDALQLLSRFSSKRDALTEELKLIYTALRDLTLLKKSDSAPLFFYESYDTAFDICESASTARLFSLIDTVSESIERISRNANVKLTLTSLMSKAEML